MLNYFKMRVFIIINTNQVSVQNIRFFHEEYKYIKKLKYRLEFPIINNI